MLTFQIYIYVTFHIRRMIMRLSTLILVIYFTLSFGCQNVSSMLLKHWKPHKLFYYYDMMFIWIAGAGAGATGAAGILFPKSYGKYPNSVQSGTHNQSYDVLPWRKEREVQEYPGVQIWKQLPKPPE